MADEFSDFMQKQLVRFIHQETGKGHTIESIRSTLLQGGHHEDMIEECIESLKKHHFNLQATLSKPMVKKKDRKAYYDVLNAVIRYIEHMISHGHSIKEVEDILYKHGHTKEIVNKAIDEVVFGTKKKPKKDNQMVLPVSVGIVALFMIWVAASANESIALVFQGFMPLLFSVLIAGVAAQKSPEFKDFAWILPFLLAGLFYFAGVRGAFPTMDVEKLAVLNIIFALPLVAAQIFNAPTVKRKPKKPKEKGVEKETSKEKPAGKPTEKSKTKA